MSIQDFEIDPEVAEAEAEYLANLSENEIAKIFNSVDEYAAEQSDKIIARDIILSHFREFLWDESKQKRYMVLQGSSGTGKAAPANSRIVVPSGYTTMGKVSIGDRVCTIDGGHCEVIDKIDAGVQKVYRITFEDGRTCEAGEHHRWRYCISSRVFKSGAKWKQGTTATLIKLMRNQENNKHKNNVLIPLPEPVYLFNRGKLKIPPSLLGLLLGDASLSEKCIEFGTTDEELREYVKSTEFFTKEYVRIEEGKKDYRRMRFNGELKKCINELGLIDADSYSKFIPQRYKFTSKENRWEIIRGLLDTDGTCDRLGHPQFSSSSKKLAEDVQWIVRSLGGKCTLTEKNPTYTHNGCKKQGRISYILYINFGKEGVQPFKLHRKQEKVKPYNGGRVDLKLGIRSIDYVRDEQCYCITVDHDSHMYLTEDFIPTINSHSVCQKMCYLFLTCKNTEFAVVRASSPNLVRSVYLGSPSIVEQLAKWGVPISKWLNKTERRIINPINNNVMYFIGLDDPEKIKSMNVNYTWLEEATELNDDKFKQLQTRNRRPNPNTGKFNQMFITYNPISIYNWVIQRFIVSPTQKMIDDSAIHYSNIKQNPFLDVDYIKTVYDIASRAREYFMTYILGVPGVPLGLIYPNIKFEDRDDWPSEVRDCRPYYGVDWGINDPTVLVECRDLDIQEDGFKRKRVYVRLRYYETGKKSSDLIAFLNDKKISRSAPIYCDHNMKEGNLNLQQEGFNAQIAMKNIFAGISYLKGLEIIVDNHDPISEFAYTEVSGYTWEKDPENQERFLDRPIDRNNHFCFKQGTLISTDMGEIPIENIKKGMNALTLRGPMEITEWAKTSNYSELLEIKDSCGNTLCVTPNHKIWSEDRKSFICARDMHIGESLICRSNTQNTKVRNIIDIQMPHGVQIGDISCGETKDSTESYTRITSDPYRLKCTSTTEMGIVGTINQKTSNASQYKSTSTNTLSPVKDSNGKNSISNLYENSQRNGTEVKRAESGIDNTELLSQPTCSRKNTHASNVGLYFSKNHSEIINSVPTIASLNSEENQGLITSCTCARCVEKNLYVINTPKENSVQKSVVVSIQPVAGDSTYDITVKDVHHCFANNILTSNCDALRYSAFSHHMNNNEVSAHTLNLSYMSNPPNPSPSDPMNPYANSHRKLETKWGDVF